MKSNSQVGCRDADECVREESSISREPVWLSFSVTMKEGSRRCVCWTIKDVIINKCYVGFPYLVSLYF